MVGNVRKVPCGRSTRLSAPWVSMRPSDGCSTARTKPFVIQKSRSAVQAASGLALTTSQRSLPARAPLAVADLYDAHPDAGTPSEVPFEDGAKGTLAARVKVRDVATVPAAPVLGKAA